MLDENVDLVAGDFNGAAWRRDNSNNISIIEEAFGDCALPMPPGPTPLWGPQSIPGLTKSWACARLTRVVTTKPGFTSTLSDGATNSHTVRNTIEGSS